MPRMQQSPQIEMLLSFDPPRIRGPVTDRGRPQNPQCRSSLAMVKAVLLAWSATLRHHADTKGAGVGGSIIALTFLSSARAFSTSPADRYALARSPIGFSRIRLDLSRSTQRMDGEIGIAAGQIRLSKPAVTFIF